MKTLFSLLTFLLLVGAVTGQTKVTFSKFDAWRQNSITMKMEYAETFYESGYLEVNKIDATVIVYNSRLNQKELFRFDSFVGLEMGHYLAFSKGHSFSFVPEDGIVLLKTNDTVVMQFDLTGLDVQKLKEELR